MEFQAPSAESIPEPIKESPWYCLSSRSHGTLHACPSSESGRGVTLRRKQASQQRDQMRLTVSAAWGLPGEAAHPTPQRPGWGSRRTGWLSFILISKIHFQPSK